jgi:hypothetical protein
MYKRLFLFVGIAMLAVLLWSLAGTGTDTSFKEAQDLLRFRRIGHELLLSAGDASSRVLPIQKISDNEFRLEFENAFAFTPDSLVSVVSRILNASGHNLHYVVNASEINSREVMYSFGWPSLKEEIPCRSRRLPEGRYAVNILVSSQPPPGNRAISIPVIAAGLMAICLGIFAWRFTRRKEELAPATNNAVLNTSFSTIGQFKFYNNQQLLVFDQQTIELTSKETKLLRIFSESPNEVIDRNRLLKEGWEDEGVITGRSLDMYVSKLRKKLQADPAVSIINVHGKGYRLNC